MKETAIYQTEIPNKSSTLPMHKIPYAVNRRDKPLIRPLAVYILYWHYTTVSMKIYHNEEALPGNIIHQKYSTPAESNENTLTTVMNILQLYISMRSMAGWLVAHHTLAYIFTNRTPALTNWHIHSGPRTNARTCIRSQLLLLFICLNLQK